MPILCSTPTLYTQTSASFVLKQIAKSTTDHQNHLWARLRFCHNASNPLMSFYPFMLTRSASILLLSVVALSASATAFAAPITGVTATSSITHCCALPLENIVNGSGLSSYDTTATHIGGIASFIGNSRIGSIDFNLNGVYKVSQVAIWNGAYGIKQYSLESSTDGTIYTPITGFPVSLALLDSGVANTAEIHSFGPVLATRIRMNILEGYSVSNNSSIREVMFLGDPATLVTVPEPGMPGKAGLAIVALGALWMLRSRAGTRTAS